MIHLAFNAISQRMLKGKHGNRSIVLLDHHICSVAICLVRMVMMIYLHIKKKICTQICNVLYRMNRMLIYQLLASLCMGLGKFFLPLFILFDGFFNKIYITYVSKYNLLWSVFTCIIFHSFHFCFVWCCYQSGDVYIVSKVYIHI